jgi:hypothetical protein
MPVDFNELRRIYNASTHISFPNDLRTIIDALKQGDEHDRRVADRLEAIDTTTDAGRDLARRELSSMFRPPMSRSMWDGARRRKTRRRKTRKTRRGGSTMPVDAALMKEMKLKHEKDLKKTGIDMRKKIVAIANELKARGHSLGEDLLTTLNAPVEYGDGVENAKSMLMGFFRNVPEVPDTTRKSMGGSTRKSRR